MTAEGTFPKSDGDILYASEVNNFVSKSVKQLYTGDGFDTVSTSTPGSDEDSHELDAVTAINCGNADYIRITILGTVAITSDVDSTGNYVQLKAEIKTIITSPHPQTWYALPCANFYLGHRVRHGGSYPDYVKRLFQKKYLTGWQEGT